MRLTFLTLAICSVAQSYRYNQQPCLAKLFLQSVNTDLHVTAPDTTFARFVKAGPPAQRLPINEFGVSTPPPPVGAGQDPATLSCGVNPPFCARSRYRTLDGSCNNLARPTWGTPQTPYGRLTPYNYADGISAWPVSSTGHPLPNPREISVVLFPDMHRVDPNFTLNTQQWGQIITHDMSFTGGVAQTNKDNITCCDDNGRLAPNATVNPTCASIIYPPDDPVRCAQGTECFNFVRTVTTRDIGCTAQNAPAEPITVVTSYMDLSLVYGNNKKQASAIRAFKGGRLRTVLKEGREFPPPDSNITLTSGPSYITGDVRVTQNPQLLILQILLMREHNRIADSLRVINPHWNDETLYQEARRIHIAEMQHINYYEYLQLLLGYKNMVKNKLIYPGAQGYVNDYNPNVDPSILDEHATAAFRHFHTLIRGQLKMITENRNIAGSVRISDWLNRPLLVGLPNAFDNLARGLATQEQDFSDQSWDSEMTQFLFKGNKTFGGDLRATDIQRGRDHGLGTYAATRCACGLHVPKTFHDMLDYISAENVRCLQSLYKSPQDIDLVVGGSLEKSVPETQVGPTFLCILTEQFYRTRVGDRYFYENGADPDTAFTPSQLKTIRHGASMARIFCDNGDNIHLMQPQAFKLISHSNKLVPCEQLPSIDLSLWQDARGHYK